MKLWHLLLPALALSVAGWASVENFRPFEPGQSPNLFPMEGCKPLQQPIAKSLRGKTLFYAAHNSPQIRLKLEASAIGDYAATVVDGTGRTLSTKTLICESNELGGVAVYCADLNRDGKPDFIIEVGLGGNGLGACKTLMVFALSSASDYKFTSLPSLCPDGQDFLDLKNDGECHFIKTDFIYGDKGKDGKAHNYWVYNVYEFIGSQLRQNNSAISGFPKWVWWSNKANHKATDQLTETQKAKLWKEQTDK